MKKLIIKSTDNYSLSAIYNDVPKSQKIVIFAHGMAVNKDDESIFARAEQTLNKLEISTIRFDFRAHGESSGKSDKDFTISGELIDLDTFVQYAKKRRI